MTGVFKYDIENFQCVTEVGLIETARIKKFLNERRLNNNTGVKLFDAFQ